MRNIILIIGFFVGIVIVKAQVIVPIETAPTYIKANLDKPNPQPVYYKDVNNVLDKYVGAWEGIYDNKTYYFEITKQVNVSGKYITTITRDDLYIKIRITDNNTNTVIYDKFSLAERFHIKLASLLDITENSYVMGYQGNTSEEIECGDIGEIHLESFDNGDKLKVYVEPEFIIFYVEDGEPHPCPDGRILPPFPDNENDALILTKLISQPGLGN